MKIEYRSNYFDDPCAKTSFERYAKKIFGLDFSRWKARGLWDNQYRPFSAFAGGECVASICVYPSEMKVDGVKRKGAQLLTVGTLPEYRLQGIQREIWKRAHAWINQECDFAFLFTDESAAGFYEKLGLRRQEEYFETVKCPQPADQATLRFRKLNLEQDSEYAILERLAQKREMVSNRIGFLNPNLLLFMFLYLYQNWSYYLEDIDTVIVVEEMKDRLRIHDIVAKQMPRLSDIESFLAHFKKEEVDFLFCTDRLGLDQPTKKKMVEDSLLFVSDNFELEGQFVFPYSIRA
jgi:ribosomal protein S18 acetylase RimI-like enzyme